MGKLADQVNVDEPRRKDFKGIDKHIEMPATRCFSFLKKSPIEALKLRHVQQIGLSLQSGSVRA